MSDQTVEQEHASWCPFEGSIQDPEHVCWRADRQDETEALRYFIDTAEVSEAVARRAEARGAASVIQGGSGVVPEHLRSPCETAKDYLRPWVLLSTPPERSD